MEHIDLTIDGAGKDAGKTFRITEMNAFKGEWWAVRLLGVLADGDTAGELASLSESGGLEALAASGLNVVMKCLLKADPEKIRPLWDEMTECWTFVPDAGKDFSRRLVDGDILEIGTLLFLRMKTMELHLDFFSRSIQTLMSTNQG